MADVDIDLVSQAPVVIEWDGEVRFPANLFAGAGIILSRNGLDFTFSLDYANAGFVFDWSQITNKPVTFEPIAASVDARITTLVPPLIATAIATVPDTNARVAVRKNSTGSVSVRRRVNLIEGVGVALTVADDAANEEVDVTIAQLPGSVIDSVSASYATSADLTAIIPLDDTIPQVTEGTQILSLSLTPKNTTNKLRVRFSGVGGLSAVNASWFAAFFLNGGANAVRSGMATVAAAGNLTDLYVEHEFTPASTSAQTFTVRVGPSSGATLRMNGNSGSGRFLGGSMAAILVIEEIAA